MTESDNILVRQANTVDAESIAKIESLSLGNEAWSEASVSETLNRNGQYFVAELKGEIIGSGGFTVVLDEGDITNIAVHPNLRRQGIGRLILEAILNSAKAQGLSFVTLEVRSKNIAAISLYEKYGFTKRGERKDFYSNPTDSAIIMTIDF